METLDYKKLFDVGARITLSSDFINQIYDPNSWQQDCINAQKKYKSLKIIEVTSLHIRIEGIKSNWVLGIYSIDLHQLEPYRKNPEILYAFADNQARLHKKRNISCPLNAAFLWSDSKEGCEFWNTIYENKKVNNSEIKETKQQITQNNNHEIRLQKQKASIIRGTRPEGSRICSSKHKASIRSRQISYTACHC